MSRSPSLNGIICPQPRTSFSPSPPLPLGIQPSGSPPKTGKRNFEEVFDSHTLVRRSPEPGALTKMSMATMAGPILAPLIKAAHGAVKGKPKPNVPPKVKRGLERSKTSDRRSP